MILYMYFFHFNVLYNAKIASNGVLRKEVFSKNFAHSLIELRIHKISAIRL